MSLTREKLDQAAALMTETDLDLWITFVRETVSGSDPVLPLILDGGLTWASALIVAPSGERVAIVGNYDADPLVHSGDWNRVVPYVQGIREDLRAEVQRLLPQGGRIGVNFSTDDEKADGLSHGMFLQLAGHLEGLPVELISAAPLLRNLRGQKSSEEVRRMRDAIAETDRIFAQVPNWARVGVSERAVYDAIQAEMHDRRLGYAWDQAGNPIVNSGPNSMIGHGIPSASIFIEPGHIFHIDLGVIKDGYSSDIQRCWFLGNEVPADAQAAFDAVYGAISAGAAVLRPGVQGHEVDAAARAFLVGAGYPEYMHAFGHQVGRVAHDGGSLLGPAWDRYGQLPFHPIRVGEVYTLELGITVPGRGYLGLEEMAQVTETGIEWLSERQTSLPTLPA